MKRLFGKTLLGVTLSLGLFSCVDTSSNGLTSLFDVKEMTDGDTITIQGMGHYNYRTLLQTKQIVEETYGVPTKIIDPIVLGPEFYIDGSINSDKCLSDFDNDINKIIVTNERCYSENMGEHIGGQGEMFGNIVIIGKNHSKDLKRVLIHEIGHNQGLSHCDNPNCVMSVNRNNDENNLNFCENCKKD